MTLKSDKDVAKNERKKEIQIFYENRHVILEYYLPSNTLDGRGGMKSNAERGREKKVHNTIVNKGQILAVTPDMGRSIFQTI